MSDLRTAAQQALEALQNCANGEDDVLLTRDALANLRAALAEPVQGPDPTYKLIGCVQHDCEECQRRTQRKPLTEPGQEPSGCDHCNQPLYAAVKCRVCGRVTQQR